MSTFASKKCLASTMGYIIVFKKLFIAATLREQINNSWWFKILSKDDSVAEIGK